ncbi:hypothetical protein C7974DRAFT_135664 [Boeremia exigua]|uniref:uncharacterized protein n=1 Tax=Boeremia exigua TaxID=749465 RepID=UPI001E8D8E57|nr:uncharacterized protein C7974DRAFT_135664 [Boeremia exigua]KAH6639625.1 hypothetical protein C7974DRAFT_135664 [Boeremia exigua]
MAYPAIYDTPFDELPDKKRVWVGTPGSREEGLAKLALLTPSVVAKAAADEIKTGQRVSLNWELPKLEIAGFGRQPFEHKILECYNGLFFDDVYAFNPQQGSQWDGLRHFSQTVPGTEGKGPDQRVFYGGTTGAEIQDRGSTRIGIQHWAKEGIVGRGVLIDYASWAETNGVKYSALRNHEVKLTEILEIARECNITFRRGDILLVRTGLTKEWDTILSPEDKKSYAENPADMQHAGVEATEDVLRWLWNEGFAAVAGDSVSWEVYPPSKPEPVLHEYLLAGWGMPIGEMFDLEGLAEICRKENRWTFFLTSAPFNMPGGVSSPPNCMALF